jgi:hypothetical protein
MSAARSPEGRHSSHAPQQLRPSLPDFDPASMLSSTSAWTKPSGDKAEVLGFAAGGEWHI